MAHFQHNRRRWPSLSDRIADATAKGLRFATRAGMAFGLAVVSAIFLGAALTDNGLVQIFVTVFAALGLWVPILVALLSVDRWIARRRQAATPEPAGAAAHPVRAAIANASWQRLVSAAPWDAERIGALQRSLEASALSFHGAHLDPDAHDLCVLIDRRLPELIERELDTLPPDDRGRKKAVGELVELVEQFARHCSRKREGQGPDTNYQAEVLRRRFEQRLSPHPFGDQ